MRMDYFKHRAFIIRQIKDGRTSTEIAKALGGGTGTAIWNHVKNHIPEYYNDLVTNGRNKSGNARSRYRVNEKYITKFIENGGCFEELALKYNVLYNSLLSRLKSHIECTKYDTLLKKSKFNAKNKQLNDNFDSIIYKKANHVTVNQKNIALMIKFSEQGFGIDAIGKLLKIHGTTVRDNLIKTLGKEEYSKLHPSSRFKENNGWNGKAIKYEGVTYQSLGEIKIAKILQSFALEFKSHTYLNIDGKIYYPDFYLPSLDIYVEYAGMLDKSFYIQKFVRKINDYTFAGIKYLIVAPSSIDLFVDKLKSILAKERG